MPEINSYNTDVRRLLRNPDAVPLIQARLPFTNRTGSFRGVAIFELADLSTGSGRGVNYHSPNGNGYISFGMLPSKYTEMFLSDLEKISSYRGNVYVVMSYDTVIGWTRSLDHSGGFYVPEEEYTQTTTQHQSYAAQCRADYAN